MGTAVHGCIVKHRSFAGQDSLELVDDGTSSNESEDFRVKATGADLAA